MNLEEADPDYSDLKRVEHAIDAIYDKSGNDLTSEELSRISGKFVQDFFGESVYSGLVSITTLHLENVAKSVEASEDSNFLEELSQKWMDFNTALVEIGQILKGMDLTFVRNTRKTPVHVVCRNIWRDNIINSSNIAIRLKSTLLEAVRKERAGIHAAKFLVRHSEDADVHG
ncbi:unnamed protein product [Lactuca saligna]|uniref:Cullin N-terminal domain-containing protein n=1 Tax=Lactuca saligna TaxID=75948 RepID=A0AA35VDY3_LACSI|nr:unnamed protein product [Lactuca saligna]